MKITSEMKNALIVSVIIALLALIPGNSFSQENKNSKEKNSGNPPALTVEQKAKIKTILSAYNPSTLTADQAKAIHGKFREAGVHAGPEMKQTIIEAGFDPDKLRDLDPPSMNEKDGKQKPPAKEERMRTVKESIIKPLALTDSQQETVTKAFSDFFESLEGIVKTQSDPRARPDKSKVEPLEKIRNEKIRQVLNADQFKKFLELELAARPQ